MLRQAVAQQVPFGWVTADSIYGDYRSLRLWLESLSKRYVLAVSRKETLVMRWQQRRVGDLLDALPQTGWQRLSAGEGAKGPRRYDWYWLPLDGSVGRGLETVAAGTAQPQRSHRTGGLCLLSPAGTP